MVVRVEFTFAEVAITWTIFRGPPVAPGRLREDQAVDVIRGPGRTYQGVPTAAVLDEAWTADRADRAFATVTTTRTAAGTPGSLAARRSGVLPRKRWAVLSGAAASVAATAFAVGALLTPTGLPAASALGDPARTAASGPHRALGPGEYLQVVAREVQDNHPGAGAAVPELGSDSDRTLESWTDAGGRSGAATPRAAPSPT